MSLFFDQKPSASLPVRVYPANHPAREWQGRRSETSADLFRDAASKEQSRSKGIIRSSFDDLESLNVTISPSSNGFVRGVFQAYSKHHHITIRPEDVWFAILTQISFHINAHAEELRSHFVAHSGQKQVKVRAIGTIHTVDIGHLAVELTHAMQEFIVDPDLRTWIMPNFTTTTQSDTVIAAILMMGSMQKYFSYLMVLDCGIPSVTLLGEREDWVKVRERLDKLLTLGDEPESFAALLIPVLDIFIRSYDDPEGEEVTAFWNKICHHEDMGSGPTYLSGWITAFCFWDVDGTLLRNSPGAPQLKYHEGDVFDIDLYHDVDTDKIPEGMVSVPVTVDDNGYIYKTRMVAGSVGMNWTSSGQTLDESHNHNDPRQGRMVDGEFVPDVCKPELGQRLGLDSLQPVSGWWMYELKEEKGEE